jgi:hypothetical protein
MARRALTAVVFLFTRVETGGRNKAPLITIPARSRREPADSRKVAHPVG